MGIKIYYIANIEKIAKGITMYTGIHFILMSCGIFILSNTVCLENIDTKL